MNIQYLQNCRVNSYSIFHQYWYPSCVDKNEGSRVESSPSTPWNVSGVALKETEYIAFECQAFDPSGVGFDEILMVDYLKKKIY